MRKIYYYLTFVILLSGCYSGKLYNHDAVLYIEEGSLPPVKQLLFISQLNPKDAGYWKKFTKAMQTAMAAKGIGTHFIAYTKLSEAVNHQIADTVAACKIDFILRINDEYNIGGTRPVIIGPGTAPINTPALFVESSYTFMGYVTGSTPYKLVLKCACTQIRKKEHIQASDCLIKEMIAKKLIQ